MSSKNVLTKKREVLPYINNIIAKLVEMSKDAATLEYNDNDRASRKLKLDFIKLRENEFTHLHKHILSIREEINNNYNQSKKQRSDEQQ